MVRLSAPAAALSLILLGAGSVPARAANEPCVELAGFNDRCPTWTEQYGAGTGSLDDGMDVLVTPDGATAITLGSSQTTAASVDTVLVANDASTGARRWVASWGAPGTAVDASSGMTSSPDGSVVYVTGSTCAQATDPNTCDLTILAFSTADGSPAWDLILDGPAGGLDAGGAVATSPDGRTVYVTGTTTAPVTGGDATLVAVDAAAGEVLWQSRHDGNRLADSALAIGLSEDGERVFVSGATATTAGKDVVTVAFDAADGERLWWVRRDDHGGEDNPTDLEVGRGRVIVSATTDQGIGAGQADFALVAYDDETGDEVWTARYDGGMAEVPNDIALSPDETTVFATGLSRAATGGYDWATVALDAADGQQLWVKRFNGLANNGDAAWALEPSPDGERLYVAGDTLLPQAIDSAHQVIAYDTDDGAVLWSALHRGGGPGGGSFRQNIALSPNGGSLFYATRILATTADPDLLALRYDLA